MCGKDLRKPFEARISLFNCAKGVTLPFSPPRRWLKHVQACLSVRKELEGSFHHFGGPVRPMQSCLCAGKTCESRFNRQEGGVKSLQAC